MSVNVQKLGSGTGMGLECASPMSAGVRIKAFLEHTCRLVWPCLHLSAGLCM